MTLIERHASHGGWQEVWQHNSDILNCKMKLGVYLPPQAQERKLPVLYWLSGLSCSEQNFITKSGMQKYAAELGVIIVAPDTSPRGDKVSDNAAYDLGQGAGFYVNATQPPWNSHYRMYDYVLRELPGLIEANFPATSRKSISGHSMGGHGALILALRNPDDYASVSAFSPIVAPCQVPWGQKAFSAYLGGNKADWESWDATQLILAGKNSPPMLIDQGLEDPFFNEQLRTTLFETACRQMGVDAEICYQPGYDHSYYFIASFIGKHLAFHAKYLSQ